MIVIIQVESQLSYCMFGYAFFRMDFDLLNIFFGKLILGCGYNIRKFNLTQHYFENLSLKLILNI